MKCGTEDSGDSFSLAKKWECCNPAQELAGWSSKARWAAKHKPSFRRAEWGSVLSTWCGEALQKCMAPEKVKARRQTSIMQMLPKCMWGAYLYYQSVVFSS